MKPFNIDDKVLVRGNPAKITASLIVQDSVKEERWYIVEFESGHDSPYPESQIELVEPC